ncbi:MAG: hypothetical protein AB1522_14140 [Chloroflexota bacterium]
MQIWEKETLAQDEEIVLSIFVCHIPLRVDQGHTVGHIWQSVITAPV